MGRPRKDITVEGNTVYASQPGANIYVSLSTVCAAVGLDAKTAGKLATDGVLIRRKYGTTSVYDLVGSAKSYIDFLKERFAAAVVDEKVLERQKKAAEAKDKEAKAEISAIRLAELQGQMHRSEDVKAVFGDLVTYINDVLSSFAGKISVGIATCTTDAQRQDVVHKEINAVRRELSKYTYDPKDFKKLVRARENWETDGDEDENE